MCFYYEVADEYGIHNVIHIYVVTYSAIAQNVRCISINSLHHLEMSKSWCIFYKRYESSAFKY